MNWQDCSTENCPVGLTLGIVGQSWTLLVIREAIKGVRRFEDFQSALGASRPILTQRLRLLVEEGILERVAYREGAQRTRHQYALTRKGRDLFPVIVALREWGERYLLDSEPSVITTEHRDCGATVGLRLVCTRGHSIGAVGEIETRPAAGTRARDGSDRHR